MFLLVMTHLWSLPLALALPLTEVAAAVRGAMNVSGLAAAISNIATAGRSCNIAISMAAGMLLPSVGVLTQRSGMALSAD